MQKSQTDRPISIKFSMELKPWINTQAYYRTELSEINVFQPRGRCRDQHVHDKLSSKTTARIEPATFRAQRVKHVTMLNSLSAKCLNGLRVCNCNNKKTVAKKLLYNSNQHYHIASHRTTAKLINHDLLFELVPEEVPEGHPLSVNIVSHRHVHVNV